MMDFLTTYLCIIIKLPVMWQLCSLFWCSEPWVMRIWITSFSLSCPFFLSTSGENALKILWHGDIVLVPLWCKLLWCDLVSNVQPQFPAAASSVLSGVRDGTSPTEGDRSEWAMVQHRWQGASSPGRYRLLPAAVLECLPVTQGALAWLVYWGANSPRDWCAEDSNN